MVEPNANDSAAALRLFCKEQVAELVILEELVGDRRDASFTVSPGSNLLKAGLKYLIMADNPALNFTALRFAMYS